MQAKDNDYTNKNHIYISIISVYMQMTCISGVATLYEIKKNNNFTGACSHLDSTLPLLH
jgi:hypothetical protein